MARLGRPRSVQVEERWRQLLQRFKGTADTVGVFCKREGVSPASFYQWRRLRKLDQGPNGKGGPLCLPVRIVSPRTAQEHAVAASAGRNDEGDTAIEIVVGPGRYVRVVAGFDAATLGRVLAVLEGQAC